MDCSSSSSSSNIINSSSMCILPFGLLIIPFMMLQKFHLDTASRSKNIADVLFDPL